MLMRQKEEIKNVVQKEHDDKIYELANDPLGDSLANILGPEEEDILDEGFANEKEREDEVLENIKEEYGFEEKKMSLMKFLLLTNLNFFMVISRATLFNFLSPNNNKESLLLSLYLTKDKT